MENILLVINIILAAILVVLVLFQKSEGGALGIGVSQDNFMFSRSAGNFLTKATAIVAALLLMVAHLNWLDPEITNLVPVLNSYWLMIHVSIIVASYGFFSLGAIIVIFAPFLNQY